MAVISHPYDLTAVYPHISKPHPIHRNIKFNLYELTFYGRALNTKGPMTTHLNVIKTLGFITFLAALATGCSKQSAATPAEAQDFFTTVVPANWQAEFTLGGNTLADCEKSLSQAVCETDASTQDIQVNLTGVQCSANSKNYLPTLMKIVGEMPERLRPSICSVYRLFISDNIPSTAFASPILNSATGRMQGAYIGSRKSTFLQQPSISALATWKEQLVFGGSEQFLSNDPQLVQLDYGLKTSMSGRDGLFYVLVHELGHLIDFNNTINQTDCGNGLNSRNSECRPLAGTWGTMSWEKTSTPLAGFEYYMREFFCFYDCDSHVDIKNATSIYQSMQQSAFLTSYSGVNPMEDFAEFWAWYVMIHYKDPHFKITVPGGAEIDMNLAFTQNPKIMRKLEYIDRLWNLPNLKIRN